MGAAAAVMGKTIQVAKDFDAQMSKVKAITGSTSTEMQALTEDAKRLGASTSKSATQVGQLQVEFAKLGFSTQEILNATEATIALAEATGSDLAQSAVVAASTVRGFGLASNETQRVVDVMAKSFTSSALDLEKFETAMSQVAPVAKASNVSIEESTAVLGVLSDAGLDASTSGTSLRNIYLELQAKGLTWAQAMDKIRSAQNKGSTSMELFGKRGAVAGLIIADNIDKIAGLTDKLEASKGAADEMATTVRDNLQGDVQNLQSAWEGLFLSIDDGQGSLTAIARWFVQTLVYMINTFMKFKNDFAKGWNSLVKDSAVFRAAITVVASSVRLSFANMTAAAKILWGVMSALGKAIQFIFTGQLSKAMEAWDDLKEGFVNGMDDIKKAADTSGKNLVNAFNGKDIDGYKMKVSEATVLVGSQTEAVKNYADVVTGAYKKSKEAAEKQLKLEREKANLLFGIMEAGQAKDLLALKKKYEEKKKLFVKHGLDQKDLTEWLNRETDIINSKYAKIELDKKAKIAAKNKAMAAKELARHEKVIAESNALRLLEIDLLEATEDEKTKLRLEQEKKRLKAVLNLNRFFGKEMSKLEIEAVKTQIALLEAEIDKLGGKTARKDIYEMLGLKITDEGKQKISESFQVIKTGIYRTS